MNIYNHIKETSNIYNNWKLMAGSLNKKIKKEVNAAYRENGGQEGHIDIDIELYGENGIKLTIKELSYYEYLSFNFLLSLRKRLELDNIVILKKNIFILIPYRRVEDL